MPISKTANAVALAAAFCFGTGCLAPMAQARSFTPLPGPALSNIVVQDGAITITGPKGYCLDPTATQERADGVFVMLGDCTRLFRQSRVAPEHPAVLTALVSAPSSEPQSPSAAELERYFRSGDGRAALSVDNRAETVEIQRSDARDGILLLLTRDSSAGRSDGLADTSWRAIFALGNRLVSLSVTAHVEEPIELGQSRALLDDFIAAVLKANPAPPEPISAPVASAEETLPEPQEVSSTP